MQHTPKLFEAAKLAAAFKGPRDYFPGMAVVWARARDGERAVNVLGAPSYPEYWPATIFANGVAQMLLQSHAGEIDVLPALPKLWSKGRVYGIRAEGGFTLNFSWKDGRIETLSVFSACGKPAQVRCQGVLPTIRSGGKQLAAQTVSEDVIRFATEKGKWYVLAVREE
jgi:alpha-L-fucosidase 2